MRGIDTSKLLKIELPAGTPCWEEGWSYPVPNKDTIMCFMHRVSHNRIYASYCCDQTNREFWFSQDELGSMPG